MLEYDSLPWRYTELLVYLTFLMGTHFCGSSYTQGEALEKYNCFQKDRNGIEDFSNIVW